MDTKGVELLFEYQFVTSAGVIGLLAERVVNGTEMHLRDVVILPIDDNKLLIGNKVVLDGRRELAVYFGKLGFRTVRITGERLTGANAGKMVNVTFATISENEKEVP